MMFEHETNMIDCESSDMETSSCSSSTSFPMEITDIVASSSSHSKKKSTKTKKTNSNKKGGITFAPYVNMHLVLHINDYEYEELDACWYEKEELKEIKKDVRKTVKKIVCGTPLKDENDKVHGECALGLESFTPDGLSIKQNNKCNGVYVVLDEQDNQIMWNVRRPQDIADVYRQVSYECSVQACLRGIQYQAAARASSDNDNGKSKHNGNSSKNNKNKSNNNKKSSRSNNNRRKLFSRTVQGTKFQIRKMSSKAA